MRFIFGVFRGRTGRRGYVTYNVLLSCALFVVYRVRDALAAGGQRPSEHAIALTGASLLYLLIALLLLTLNVRRLRDIGSPLWCVSLALIPFLNIYLLILLTFKKGGASSVDPVPDQDDASEMSERIR